jgi:hypothetical protein
MSIVFFCFMILASVTKHATNCYAMRTIPNYSGNVAQTGVFDITLVSKHSAVCEGTALHINIRTACGYI